MKSRRSKATDIPQKVKQAVWERDGGRCVICGNTHNVMPNAHFISRANGGLGIEENVVTLCTELTPNKCHRKYDFGTKAEREAIGEQIEEISLAIILKCTFIDPDSSQSNDSFS